MMKKMLWVLLAALALVVSGVAFAMPGADAVTEVKDSILNDWGPPIAVIGILIVAVRKKFLQRRLGRSRRSARRHLAVLPRAGVGRVAARHRRGLSGDERVRKNAFRPALSGDDPATVGVAGHRV
jgi:hypothetical protein